jgi:hypothetical protein
LAVEVNMTRAYHFVPTDFALQDLRHRRLKIARLDELNDPFELWAIAQSDRHLRQALRKTKADFARLYGLLCSSLSWHNPLLWSHYADRHRGLALGFDVTEEILKPVSYVAERPTLTKIDPTVARWLLFTKFIDWQYEQEGRIFTTLQDRDPSGLYFGKFNEQLVLREVIVGPPCKVTKKDLRDALDGHEGVTLTKGRLAFKTFDVVRDKRCLRWITNRSFDGT